MQVQQLMTPAARACGPGASLCEAVQMMMGASQRRRIAERMQRGKEEHRRRGGHVAGGIGTPFGMGYSKGRGWYYTDDAAIVREAFRRERAHFCSPEEKRALERAMTLVRWSTLAARSVSVGIIHPLIEFESGRQNTPRN